jgi:hypothetical protein
MEHTLTGKPQYLDVLLRDTSLSLNAHVLFFISTNIEKKR